MPKISIIIPVYNMEKYLGECLNSVLTQTCKDIEVICVDDHSSDGSPGVLDAFSRQDSRIRVICRKETQGITLTRKDGVFASRGEYIMFVHPEDILIPEACEKALEAVREKKADMLQFSPVCRISAGSSGNTLQSSQEGLPCSGSDILRGDLVRYCFEEKLFDHSLQNKIFRGKYCREAFGYIEEGACCSDPDFYAFFLLASCCRSCAGLDTDTSLYIRRTGNDAAASAFLNLEEYRALLAENRVLDALEIYIEERGILHYRPILEENRELLQEKCMEALLGRLAEEFRQEGIRDYMDTWGYRAMVCHLAKAAEGRADLYIEDFSKVIPRQAAPSQIHGAAVCCRGGKAGEGQNAGSLLASLLSEPDAPGGMSPYEVFLLTDRPDVPGDKGESAGEKTAPEDLPGQAEAFCISAGAEERYDAWNSILDNHSVDVVICVMEECSSTVFWDYLAIKGHRTCPFMVLACPGSLAEAFRSGGREGCALPGLFRIMDGVVLSTREDQAFAECYAPYSRILPLPGGASDPENLSGAGKREIVPDGAPATAALPESGASLQPGAAALLWKEFLEGLPSPHESPEITDPLAILLDRIVRCQQEGRDLAVAAVP
ncbi:MAG: glycosyltransferase, partial [Blautia sp.]|nr:glycosyltransferase [Blautia sp.]